MQEIKRRMGLVATGAMVLTAPLGAAQLEIDKSHSHLGFEVSYMKILDVDGEFQEYDVNIDWNEKDPSASSVKVAIQAASINTRNEKRDQHLKSPDFFDVEKFPELVFQSRKIQKAGKDKFKISGDLTMRGVTHPVEFQVVKQGPINDPWGNAKTGFQGDLTIKRSKWGLEWNQVLETGGVLVSDEVKINVSVMFIVKKA